MITEQEYHTANIPIRQYSDAGTYRCRCPDNSRERCHLKVDVIPDTVNANFTPAFLHKSYNGSFSAKGNPPPMMCAEFDSNDCNYTTTVIDSNDDFTRHLVITIPTVTENCQNVTITCLAYNARISVQLHVTSENQQSEIGSSLPPTPIVANNSGKDGTSSASSLTMVLTAMTVAQIWKSCV